MTQPLEFEIEDTQGRSFLVQFDSESLQRNLIMSITYDNLPIDVVELRTMQPKFYVAIKSKVTQTAFKFYNQKATA